MNDPHRIEAALAKNLREWRAKRGWTQAELARRADLSKGMLVQIEQAQTNPSIATLCKLANALGVALPRLVEVADEPEVRRVTRDDVAWLWRGRSRASAAGLVAGIEAPVPVELWDWRIGPRDGYDAVAHPAGTREIVYVLEGAATIAVGGVECRSPPARPRCSAPIGRTVRVGRRTRDAVRHGGDGADRAARPSGRPVVPALGGSNARRHVEPHRAAQHRVQLPHALGERRRTRLQDVGGLHLEDPVVHDERHGLPALAPPHLVLLHGLAAPRADEHVGRSGDHAFGGDDAVLAEPGRRAAQGRSACRRRSPPAPPPSGCR